MSRSTIWAGEGLSKMRASAELFHLFAGVVVQDPETVLGMELAEVPSSVVGAFVGLDAGLGLLSETHQFSDILTWRLEGPEPKCPLDQTRFVEVVDCMRRKFADVAKVTDAWLADLAIQAADLDAVSRLVSSGTARVEESEQGDRRVLAEDGEKPEEATG